MSFPSRRSTTARKPLLPMSFAGNDSALASNASATLSNPFKITQRINLNTDTSTRPRKEKENEPPQAHNLIAPPTLRSRSFRLAHASLHQRREPPFPAVSPTPTPTELCLPSFTSPAPKLEKPRLPTRLPDSPTFWLSMYFCFNLGLTIYNKCVLLRFPFPYTLSAIHALFGTLGGSLLAKRGCFAPPRLNLRETVVLVAFSVLYAVNIAVSNVSLQLVTVPFHQVVRASTPIFTIFFARLLFGTHSSRAKKISLIPVVAGVGLATFGDKYYFTPTGLLLTLLGTLLAALKTLFTHALQSPPSPTFADPLALLSLLSPLALAHCALLAHLSGELARVRPADLSFLVLVNGALAFGLNVVSFGANRRVGALGMTVAANVKQVLAVVCAVGVFGLRIEGLNALGIALTLGGGAWYACVESSSNVSLQPIHAMYY
ncbi:triose-phosphate transporter family-domain-containing protein, partial [Mycena rosella]